jgi:hypothetical protein
VDKEAFPRETGGAFVNPKGDQASNNVTDMELDISSASYFFFLNFVVTFFWNCGGGFYAFMCMSYIIICSIFQEEAYKSA